MSWSGKHLKRWQKFRLAFRLNMYVTISKATSKIIKVVYNFQTSSKKNGMIEQILIDQNDGKKSKK